MTPDSGPATSGVGASGLWASYACLAGSMVLVGSYVGLSRQLVAVFPVMLLAWLRFGLAAVAMAGWVAARPGERALSSGDRRLLFLQSFFGNFLFSVAMLYGVALTSALSAGVVMAAIPAVVALMSWAWLGERIRPRMLWAIACAIAGMAALALTREATGAGPSSGHPAAAGHPSGAANLLGHALLLVAVACEAAYVVIGKRLSGQVPPRRVSALINLWGLALVTPFGLWQAWGFDFGRVAPPTWALLVFYALAASMWTVWLWMKGLQRVPAPQAGVFTVFLPLAAAAVGVGWLGEQATWGHAVALALALAGVVLATWPAASDSPARNSTPPHGP